MVIEVNPTLQRYLDKAVNKWIDDDGRMKTDPERFKQMTAAFEKYGHYRGMFALEQLDGSEAVIDSSVFPVYNDNKEIQCYVSIGRNMTEHKKALALAAEVQRGDVVSRGDLRVVYVASDDPVAPIVAGGQ